MYIMYWLIYINTSAFIYQILSDSDTYKFIVLMSDGLSTDRKDAIVEAKLFTMSPYHIIICIGVGARVDHLELIQIASRDDSGIRDIRATGVSLHYTGLDQYDCKINYPQRLCK